MLYQTLSHTLKLAPHESPSSHPLTKNPQQLCYFYAKPSRKTLNKFGKPSTTLIIHIIHGSCHTAMWLEYYIFPQSLLQCPLPDMHLRLQISAFSSNPLSSNIFMFAFQLLLARSFWRISTFCLKDPENTSQSPFEQ